MMKFTRICVQRLNLLVLLLSGVSVTCDASNLSGWVLYQIYPRSFMDSDGDGVGDLRGITSKLPYLKETGINATWLSPIFQSPMVDFGYDISDFTTIQPEYGTMEDFEDLLKEAKRLGLKVILDFVPNHTSDNHEWFINSVNRVSGYEDYYVWHDGHVDANGEPQPPNNWVSVFYGSAWTWNEFRRQFYLHQFTREQPDLNFRNPEVVEEMDRILLFWLEKGVDGFRIDAVNHLFEVEDFRDEPLTNTEFDSKSYSYTHHYYTKDLLESYEMIYHWRNLLDDFKEKNGGDDRIMLTEAYANISFTMKWYGSSDGRQHGAHIPFNFLLITDLNGNSTARDFLYAISKWMIYKPLDSTPNWVLGNHDQPRVASRFGRERVDALNTLLLTLPGISVTYNGEEIGMEDNTEISWDDTRDPAACNTNSSLFMKFTRDPERTPFQWSSDVNAGFSSGASTWLPIHPNYRTVNLERQKSSERSHYSVYRALTDLRRHPTMIYGDFTPVAVNDNILAYTRELNDHHLFVVVINLSDQEETVNLARIFHRLPAKLRIVTAASHSHYRSGDTFSSHYANLQPSDCFVATESSEEDRSHPRSAWSECLKEVLQVAILLITIVILNNYLNWHYLPKCL
ncbi:maltase 2-like isoform X1 [Phlebotomus papatasi]|uniref:maltase 2-like isoform X1 n=1 Tax=Phlebotomus papatasi TaxID=29031 RepID=UPI0024835B8E|nr:maltase 2-like isoform X1 [Phlebotomus papatasi]